MLKVLLYGLATFMETGIGVWIFSQTFSERRILEKKYYVLEWLLYSLIFFGIYNFSVSLWQIDKKIEKYVIKAGRGCAKDSEYLRRSQYHLRCTARFCVLSHNQQVHLSGQPHPEARHRTVIVHPGEGHF